MPRKTESDSRQRRTEPGLQNRRKIARSFFKLVIQGRQKDSLRFFATDCKQHNPYIQGGMDALFDSMTSAQQVVPKFPDPSFAIKKILADGNTVAVHTELLNSKAKPSEGGLRQVHLFRFGKGDKIVEYWDVTQQVRADMPNPAGAF